mgnify:CR=1 FL=1
MSRSTGGGTRAGGANEGAYRVMVVDDSAVVRGMTTRFLERDSDIVIAASVGDGQRAISQLERHAPIDVIVLDIEMPVMDGISAVREIMRKHPTPVLMFSSLTYEGARVTLDALEAGAVDFLPKNFEEIARSSSRLQEILRKRLLEVARSHPGRGGAGGGSGLPLLIPND